MGPRLSLIAIVVAALIGALASAGACCANGVGHGGPAVEAGVVSHGHASHDHPSREPDPGLRIHAMTQACAATCGLVPDAGVMPIPVETGAAVPPLRPISAKAEAAAPATPPPRAA